MHRNQGWQFAVAVWVVFILVSVAASSQQLIIQGEDGRKTALSRADLKALPHVKLQASAHDVSATYEGVALRAVLEKAGVGFWRHTEGEAAGVVPCRGGPGWLPRRDSAAGAGSSVYG